MGMIAAAISFAAADAVLWRDPGPVESLQLAGGPLGANKAPQAPFVFSHEIPGGTSPKVVVTDSRGVKWLLKFGEEVKAENFASRIVWAAGYFADPTYFVKQGQISSVGAIGRAAQYISSTGHFGDARFELFDNMEVHHLPGTSWSLSDSSLRGTKELSGLKVLLVLLSNWDIKPENFSIVEANGHRYYAITDWGATMGRAADITGRSKWNCGDYARDSKTFVDGIEDGFMVFNYDGKKSSVVTNNIRAEHVKWLMDRLGRLSRAQVEAALAASGATEAEKACYADAFMSRLNQLKMIADAGETPGSVTTRTRIETKTVVKQVPQEEK